jgi:transcriptional regulator with XRE-family HTH domain
MVANRRWRVQKKRQREVTEASEKLLRARLRARFQYKQLGVALGVHPRTIARWEIGETAPSKEQWSKVVAVLARFVPHEAIDLAKAAGVASPIPVSTPVDTRAIDEALLRAADLLDVSPRRVRAALREIVKATTSAHGTLADLARSAEEKPPPPGDEPS